MSESNQNFTSLCYHDIPHVTLCVVLPFSIVLLSCTGIEEDGDDDYSDGYEMDTVQEEADEGDDDYDGDKDDDDEDGRYKLYIIILMHNNAFHVLLSPFSN